MHVWALGLSCETPAAPPDRAAGTRHPKNSKRAHLSAPALQTTPKFNEDPQRGKKRTNFVAGEGRNFGPPPFGAPPSGLHPRLHPSRAPHFVVPKFNIQKLAEIELAEVEIGQSRHYWKKKSWPKSKLAAFDHPREESPDRQRVGFQVDSVVPPRRPSGRSATSTEQRVAAPQETPQNTMNSIMEISQLKVKREAVECADENGAVYVEFENCLARCCSAAAGTKVKSESLLTRVTENKR